VQKPSGLIFGGIALVVVLYAVFVVTQLLGYKALSTKHVVTAEEFESTRPTRGYYRVTGGRMGYERTEGGTYFIGGTVMRTASYRAYIPFMDMKTNNLILLVEIIGDDANPKIFHEKILEPGTKPTAEDVEGTLYPSEDLDAGVQSDFASRNYPIPPGTPVLRMFDGPDKGPVYKRIALATVLMLLLVAAPFISMFLSGGLGGGKPKKRRPDKFVPSWRS
jgi:hypothetical protein